MQRYLFFGLLSLEILNLFMPAQVGAVTMIDEKYRIGKSAINVEPLRSDEPTPPPTQEAKAYAKGKHYLVNTSKPDVFSFSVSQPLLDFGKLSATNPVLRNVTLTASSNEAFQIFVFEDHPLKLPDNKAIPDTTCDNGSCSDSTAAAWKNTLTYGFGYHLESFDQDAYKQFADASHNEPLQLLLSGIKATNQPFVVTYKVNISGTQVSGEYTNTVTYLATPDY